MNPLPLPVGEFLGTEAPPFVVALAPVASARARPLLEAAPPPGARVVPSDGAAPADPGPLAIWIVAPEDLSGPHRERLLELVRRAAPARPVLLGGAKSREALLDAINTWRVARVVPDGGRADVLLDALTKTHELLRLDHGLGRAEGRLRDETRKLEEALAAAERAQRKLLQAERLATLGHVTSDLLPLMGAHLEALEQFGQTVGAGVLARDEQFEELHTLAVGGIRSMQAMLDEVRSFAASRPESYRLVPEDLDGIVKFAVEFSRFDPLARERTLTTDLGAGVRVRADALRLYQVLLNLLRNAFQASPRRGRVVVRTGRDGDAAVVDVENEGEPIPPDVRAQIFEPFFTTKGDAGLGLGLSMSRVVVERHGGTITCESAPGRRTTFRVRLPRSA